MYISVERKKRKWVDLVCLLSWSAELMRTEAPWSAELMRQGVVVDKVDVDRGVVAKLNKPPFQGRPTL
jgi:hypothetical protein